VTRKGAYARSLLSTAVLTGLLFLCAGRVNDPMLDTYIALFGISGLLTAALIDPSLDCERRNPEHAGIDPETRPTTTLLFLATLGIGALDSGRFHWTQNLKTSVRVPALGFVASGMALQVWAIVMNPYFSTTIYVQTRRGHRAATQGPYRLIRHPGYAAMLLTMAGTAISLGSLLAAIPAFAYELLILVRAAREDRFLTEGFDGYDQYASKVHYRLIPGLW
jgi:protein-S-isoprenylcysteine O-methyltransferase Ste14